MIKRLYRLTPCRYLKLKEMTERFIKTTPEAIGEDAEDYGVKTQWWLDTARPIKNEPGHFIAVETYADKDPNQFIKCEGMNVLFTDQAEYYFVCKGCYSVHGRQQFSGSTRGGDNWREWAERSLLKHETSKGWCEFCDSIFGNGGWSV